MKGRRELFHLPFVFISTSFKFCILTPYLARYAEMDKSKKNGVSHRGKALEKLQTWFAKEMSN